MQGSRWRCRSPVMTSLVKHVFAYLLKPHLVVMLAIFAGAGISGAVLLPGDAERVAMLERDGDNVRALELLERRYDAGDRSQRTLYQLEQLYQHFGKLDKARVMLEELAQSRPRDLVLQRRLVKFYRDTHNGDAYLSGLSRLVSQRHPEAACRELIAQLRLIGQYVREREVIERCRMKGYRRSSDIVRLAELENASGNKGRATALLRNVDDGKGLQGSRERLMLAALLIDAGATDETSRRGERWIMSEQEGRFADTLLAFLSHRHAYDVAMEVAGRIGRPGDSLSLWVAEIMLDRDQASAARAYLRGWIRTAKLTDQALGSRFIDAALAADDPDLALQAAHRIGLQNLSEKDLVQIAEALGATGRRDEFELVRTALSADTIVAHPLLSAMVHLNNGAKSATRDILHTMSSETLDTWRLALWARLMRETGSGAFADARLRAMGALKAAPRTTHRAAYYSRKRLRTRAARLNRIKLQKARARIAIAAKRAQNRAQSSLSKAKIRPVDPQSYLNRPKPVARPVALN